MIRKIKLWVLGWWLYFQVKWAKRPEEGGDSE